MSIELKISGISDILTDLIVVTSPEFEIIDANQAARGVLGKGHSILGSTCYNIFHDRVEACIDCPLKESMESGLVKNKHYFDKRFGEFFEERIQPVLESDSSLQGVIITNRNVTDVREAEERTSQNKKLAAIGKLSSGAAHDFNNVIAGVQGRVHLMRKNAKDSELLSHLDSIEDAVQTGSETVRRMLDYAKGVRSRTVETLDVTNLIENVIYITQPKWDELPEEKGLIVKLSKNLEDGLHLEGNKSELINALTNLMINGVDAMPDGGVIGIQSRKVDEQIQIQVSDTGTGMTADILDRIYDPFFSTKGSKGTGLGLSEVFGTMNRHGAKLDVDSKVGQGTCFTLTFESVEPLAKSAEMQKNANKKYTILALDDEEYLLETLKDFLEEDGHTVACFTHVRDALESIKSGKNFDIVITDFEMPEMNGGEFAQQVKSFNPLLPIILLSGWPISLEEDIDLAGVIDSVLTKPFTLDEVNSAFSFALHSKNIEQDKDGAN